ncbi:hypothetical protein DSM21852_20850 [Methylocystis bryophila]|uniref:Uncharacterized protein n=1 Tax=Methylocystis bryophila TaxID=655015 RepID=A0A1W6MYK9_9HYPH|nr:hypothetical protein B1812_17695 [Methylocystis bryophila]BDV38832.1 hypothetical protein DSM21852_20850 [Methylocystis bryophila]
MRRGEDDSTYILGINTRHAAYTTHLENGLQRTISYFSDLPKSTLQTAIEFYYGHRDAAESDLTIQAANHLESLGFRASCSVALAEPYPQDV